MTPVNIKRVVLAGLLAGVVYNVGGITIATILDLEAAFTRFGWGPTAAAAFIHLGIRFGLGIVSVYLYAAIRPRFGPGPTTALRAAGLIWLTAYVPGTLVLMELGLFTGSATAIELAWGLVEAGLATTLGAWAYREAPPL